MFRNALEPWHLILVVAVLVLLFGSKKLPDMARGLGRSMRILKSEAKALKDERPADAPRPDQAPHVEQAPRPEQAPGH
ncbi:Sec-independent protein translocase subunit TatA [Streptomyces sp. GS7]|uniref:Sec-independent protein translocase subunit TatA n=1 Tax=Streptomyces sp. GS7 TaxID=2692234 RepID=UPI001318AC39|nr:Sec-independent protein translocase subunit TatA [Streptomyces sp. GS7]QHC26195.1 twin-arginine translocase TatA/TatE family subunit [Streptomyces sp. GS7]